MKTKMRNISETLIAITIVAAVVLLPSVFSEAQAATTFSGSATASLTILDVRNLNTPGDSSGLLITGNALVSIEDAFFSGTASASALGAATIVGDAFDMSIGDQLQQSAQVSGSADPGGTADAVVSTDGLIDIVNNSGDLFEIDIELLVDLESTASAGNPLFEDAFASSSIEVLTLSGQFDYFQLVEADPLLGILDPPVVDTLSFTLTLNSFSSDTVDVFVDSDGFANHVVPLPAAFWLLGSGLIGLIGVARRKKAA
jgi:hypothetical protein